MNQWFEEKRMYHRDNGLVIAKYDDLLSATRYAFMMRRYAAPKLMKAERRMTESIL